MAGEVDSLEVKVSASASSANAQLDKLIANLEKVSSTLNGINTSKLSSIGAGFNTTAKSANSATTATSKLNSRIGGLSNSLSKAHNKTHSLASAFGTFYANCFLIIRAVKKLGNAIESSMDYVEAYNYFNVTMQKIGSEFSSQFEKYGYDSAESYADSFESRLNDLTTKMSGYSIGNNGELTQIDTKNLGLNPEKIMSYESNISAITNSLGLCGETSVNTSKALTMLASDMSSFKNIDLSTVMTNFQSGLIGQSRALYKYGIDITNATLQTYALKYGISTAVSEMTQADKMQLRLLAILDQSKVAWGDQANTINSVANQYRIFKQQISNLGRVIGGLFLPILQSVLPFINGLIIALQKLFTVLGFKLFGGNWLSGIMDGISSGYSGSDDALGDLEDDANGVSDSLGNAKDNAKDLKNELMGFDEINKLSDNSDTSDSGSGSKSKGRAGGIDLSNEIGNALADYESIWDKALENSQNKAQEWADKIVSAFESGDFKGIGTYISTGLTNALNSIPWETIYNGARSFGTGFAQFLNGLIKPDLFGTVGKTIASSLNAIIYNSLAFSTTFDWTNLGLSIAEGVNTFFSTFDFTSLAESINAWVQGLWTALTTAIANINWGDVYDDLITFLSNLDISTISIIVGALLIKKIVSLKLANAAITAIGSEISKALASSIASKLGIELAANAGIGRAFLEIGKQMGTVFITGFKTLFTGGGFAEAIASTGISTIVTIASGIVSAIGGVVLAVGNFFSMWSKGFSWLKEILMVIGTALAAVGAVILGVAAAPAAIVAAVVAAAATAAIVIHDNWDAICNFFSGLPAWFNENVCTPVCNFFSGLWTAVSGFFVSLWNNISSVWGTVAGWFSSTVIEPVVGFFSGFFTRVRQIFEGLWIIVQAVWIVVSGWFNDNVITPVVGFFKGLFDDVSKFFSDLWDGICNVWDSASSWFNQNVTSPIVNWFQNLWSDVSGFFSSLWGDVTNIWDGAVSWFTGTIIDPLKNAFDTVTDAIASAFDWVWNSIKNGVCGAMNAVIGGIETAINWIVDGINGILGGFNSVVKAAAKIVGADWSGVSLVSNVSLGRISMYEDGGMPNTGELFMARENGITEMVGSMGNHSAVANNDQIVEGIQQGVYNAVMAAMSQSRGNGNVNVQLVGDTGKIFKVVQDGAIDYTRQTGEPAFPV